MQQSRTLLQVKCSDTWLTRHLPNTHTYEQKSYWCVFVIGRASRELDRHERDSSGGHGVPSQVPGGHNGGATERRGAICSCGQEDSGHGQMINAQDVCLFTLSLEEDAISLDSVAQHMAVEKT